MSTQSALNISTQTLTQFPGVANQITPTSTPAQDIQRIQPPVFPVNRIRLDNTVTEYPFHQITPNFPKWKQDLASPDGNYIILKNANPTDDPFKDEATPTVFFAASVYKEIMYIAKKMASTRQEVGGFILIRKLQDMKPHFLAYDHFMVGQEVTEVRVEMDNDDLVKHMDHLRAEYPDTFSVNFHRQLMHWHLHPQMGVGFSGTDIAQQTGKDKLACRDDYRFYLCVNEKEDMNLQMVQYYPVFHRFEKVNIGLYYGENYIHEFTSARKKELDLWIKDLVTPTKNQFAYNHNHNHSPSLINNVYRPLPQSKVYDFRPGDAPKMHRNNAYGHDPYSDSYNAWAEEEEEAAELTGSLWPEQEDLNNQFLVDRGIIQALDGFDNKHSTFYEGVIEYVDKVFTNIPALKTSVTQGSIHQFNEVMEYYTLELLTVDDEVVEKLVHQLIGIISWLTVKGNLIYDEMVETRHAFRAGLMMAFLESLQALNVDIINHFQSGIDISNAEATLQGQDEILSLIIGAYTSHVIKDASFSEEMDKTTIFEEFMMCMFQE